MGWLCWPQSAAPHTHLTLQASQYLGQNTAVAIFLQNILKQLDLSCNKIQHQDPWDLSPAEGRAAVALSCAWEGVTCTNKPTSQSLLAKGVLLQLLLFNWCVVINKSWGWSRKHYSRWQDRLLILGTTPCFADSVGVLHWQSLADLPALAQGFIPMSGAWEKKGSLPVSRLVSTTVWTGRAPFSRRMEQVLPAGMFNSPGSRVSPGRQSFG